MSEKIDVWYNITPLSENKVNLVIADEGITGTYFSSEDIRDKFEDFHDGLSSINIFLNLSDIRENLGYKTMMDTLSKINDAVKSEEKPLMFRNEDFMYMNSIIHNINFSLAGTINSSQEELEKRLKRIYNNTNEYY